MKLQTWITWLCCMAVLIATIIVDVLVWNVERKNIMSEATSNALNEMYSLADAYNQTFERSQFTSNSDEVMDIQLQYFFKTRLDEYTICVRYQEIDGTYPTCRQHWDSLSKERLIPDGIVFPHGMIIKEFRLSMGMRSIRQLAG